MIVISEPKCDLCLLSLAGEKEKHTKQSILSVYTVNLELNKVSFLKKATKDS